MTRRTGFIVLATAVLAALGCEAAPPVSPASPVSVLATARPPASAALTDGRPSEAPSAEPTSDVDAAETAAVEAALQRDDLRAFLPTDLIHDGGVVLYRTLALGLGIPDSPPKWSRLVETAGEPRLVLRRVCLPGEACRPGQRSVRVTVHYPQSGTFSFRSEKELHSKPYTEAFRRDLVLRPADGQLTLAEISPISIESTGGRRGLEIARVALYGASTAPLYTAASDDATQPVSVVPTVTAGESLRVEVDVTSRLRGENFVFLSRPGDGPGKRLWLKDDGVAPDATAGDFRYTGSLVAPGNKGVKHAVVDVLDPRSFAAKPVYRANTLGFSYRVGTP